MTRALLTIVVPTYNRKDNLSLLLRTLRGDLSSLGELVTVLVSDNASTDGTQALTQELQVQWPELVVQRHPSNLGADGNFASCVGRVETRYFWIIGDDDLPKRGVVEKLVDLLRSQSPALVYMQSEWVSPISGPDQGTPVPRLRVEMLDAFDFATRVHTWFTFISGMVIDRELLMREAGEDTIRRFDGTSLIQLGWTLPLLKFGTRFAWIEDTCVLATKENTGGYKLFTVFGVNFPRIANETFGRTSPIARALVDGAVTQYLPGLIWWSRMGSGGRHVAESPWPAMRRELGNRFWFWAILVPLGRFPRWLAEPFRFVVRVGNVLRRLRARKRRPHYLEA